MFWHWRLDLHFFFQQGLPFCRDVPDWRRIDKSHKPMSWSTWRNFNFPLTVAKLCTLCCMEMSSWCSNGGPHVYWDELGRGGLSEKIVLILHDDVGNGDVSNVMFLLRALL